MAIPTSRLRLVSLMLWRNSFWREGHPADTADYLATEELEIPAQLPGNLTVQRSPGYHRDSQKGFSIHAFLGDPRCENRGPQELSSSLTPGIGGPTPTSIVLRCRPNSHPRKQPPDCTGCITRRAPTQSELSTRTTKPSLMTAMTMRPSSSGWRLWPGLM